MTRGRSKFSIQKSVEGIVNGQELVTVLLSNGKMKVKILNLGATITSIMCPDHAGQIADVILNYSNICDYVQDQYYVGATVGRVAGRISSGNLPMGEKFFQLSKNENKRHHLHGGFIGFNQKLFELEAYAIDSDGARATFTCTSPSGEEGYPGHLTLKVTYLLDQANALKVLYSAVTDAPTHVNITNHAYFNLSGGLQSAADQLLFIEAEKCVDMTAEFLPTGIINNITGTSLSFKTPAKISERIAAMNGRMFNDCYLLEQNRDLKAAVYDPSSRRVLRLYTSYPSLIFYTGDYLSAPFARHQGICLEAQYPPDAANQSYAAQTQLLPGQAYEEFIKWEFGIQHE